MGAYTDDVLFIHIPKCGGTACKEYMQTHLEDVKWPRPASWFAAREGRLEPNPMDRHLAKKSVEESRLPIGHVPLRDVPKFTGRPVDSWERIIATIRNPYVQQASQWLFWRHRYATGQEHVHDLVAASHPRLDTAVKDPNFDFHLWYELQLIEGVPQKREALPYEAYGGFYPYWLAVDGAIPENVLILRQEELGHQFPLALAPYMDGAPPDLHQANVGVSNNHMQYYNVTSALDAVEKKFRWSFENDIYNKVER